MTISELPRVPQFRRQGGLFVPEPGPSLDPVALHGLAGDVVRVLDPHTEADPAAILFGLLASFGSAVGVGPHARVGATVHGPRLFVALVGRTARARKGTAFQEVRRILEAADPLWASRVIGGFGSGESVVDAVRDPDDEDSGPFDRRLLVREPEFARILRVTSREGSTLSPIIREAFDGEPLAVRTRKNTVTATGAHIGVVADITVEELRRLLTDTEAVNGFANRFLFPYARRSKRLPNGGTLEADALDELVERTRGALHAAARVGELRRTLGAEDLWEYIYNAIDDDVDGRLGAVTARAEAHLLRLSMLYALLDGSAAIDRVHVASADAAWRYCEDSAAIIFGGDETGDRDTERLLAAVREAGPRGLDAAAQHRVFGNHRRASDLQRMRAELAGRGLAVTVEERDGGGAPRIVTRASKANEGESAND